MERNGSEVTFDGVVYAFDNEDDAIKFVECMSDSELENCLIASNGYRKPNRPKYK